MKTSLGYKPDKFCLTFLTIESTQYYALIHHHHKNVSTMKLDEVVSHSSLACDLQAFSHIQVCRFIVAVKPDCEVYCLTKLQIKYLLVIGHSKKTVAINFQQLVTLQKAAFYKKINYSKLELIWRKCEISANNYKLAKLASCDQKFWGESTKDHEEWFDRS